MGGRLSGQGNWVRTNGLRIPSAALYQTELYPDVNVVVQAGIEPARSQL